MDISLSFAVFCHYLYLRLIKINDLYLLLVFMQDKQYYTINNFVTTDKNSARRAVNDAKASGFVKI